MSTEFLDRKTYLGGSDISAILGLDPYASPLTIYERKLGIAPPTEPNYRMMRGTYFEDGIAKAYSRLHDKHLGAARVTPPHPMFEFLKGNIDRTLRSGPGGKAEDIAVVECKTAGLRQAHKWGKPGEKKVPLNYFTQATYYAALMGLPKFVIVADLAWMDDLFVEEFDTDFEFFDNMVELAARFWYDHVESKVPPPPEMGKSTSDDLIRLFPVSTGEIVPSTPELDAMDREAFELVKQKKTIDTRLAEIKVAFQFHAGEASAVECPDATWRIQDRAGQCRYKDAAVCFAEKAGIKVATPEWNDVLKQFTGRGTRFVRIPYSGDAE